MTRMLAGTRPSPLTTSASPWQTSASPWMMSASSPTADAVGPDPPGRIALIEALLLGGAMTATEVARVDRRATPTTAGSTCASRRSTASWRRRRGRGGRGVVATATGTQFSSRTLPGNRDGRGPPGLDCSATPSRPRPDRPETGGALPRERRDAVETARASSTGGSRRTRRARRGGGSGAARFRERLYHLLAAGWTRCWWTPMLAYPISLPPPGQHPADERLLMTWGQRRR